MNCFLLTAGLGTRFKPYTDLLPKPAIPLLNVPLAFYNLHVFQQLVTEKENCKLTVNLHHLPEKTKNVFEKNREEIGIPIFYSDETDRILGTGGAVKHARPTLEGRGTFLVANADVVNGFGIRDVLESHHRHQPMATIVVMEHPEAGKKYGAVWVDENHHVIDVGFKKPDKPCTPCHFVGLHLVEESVFKYIPEGPCDILRDVYMKAVAEGETVMAYKKTGLWFDAGNLEDYLQATEALLALLPKLQHQPFFLSLFRRFWLDFDRRPHLWEGEGCDHLLSLGAKDKILMDSQCQIHSTAKITGFAVFGAGAIVEKDVHLHDVVVGPGVRVAAGSSHTRTLLLGEP